MKSKGKAAVGFNSHGLSLSVEGRKSEGYQWYRCCLQPMELEILIRTGKCVIIIKKHCYGHLTSTCHDKFVCYL